jgi:hypothetical protein
VAYFAIPEPEEITGQCPHCGKGVRFVVHRPDGYTFGKDGSVRATEDAITTALEARGFRLRTYHCPLCQGLSIELIKRTQPHPALGGDPENEILRLFPRDVVREPPAEVKNGQIRQDYREAHNSVAVSKRGAAALARRALQNALREKGFTHPSDRLDKEIEEAGKSPDMPNTLREKLHFVRKVGNDGAHPNYDHAGEIVDVTDGELEMLFETLDEFFDIFYVRQERHKAVMAAREARLKGKTAP